MPHGRLEHELERASAWAGQVDIRQRGRAGGHLAMGRAGVGGRGDQSAAEASIRRRGRPAAGASLPAGRASGPVGAMTVGQTSGWRRKEEKEKN
jgi:hypothetical protein